MMMGPPAGFPMGGPPPPGLQMARPMPPPLVRKPPVIQQLVFEYGDIAPDNFVQKGKFQNRLTQFMSLFRNSNKYNK